MSFPKPIPTIASAISELTDRQLLAEFLRTPEKQSAETAMRTLIERHSPMVFGVCCRTLCERTAAEDAAQAVFLVLWKKADSLTESSIGGWLHRTALLVCRNAIRSRRIRRIHEQRAAQMDTTTRDEIDWSAVREVLDGELDRLPEKYRVPLILFHLEGHSINDIAERMSVAASTVGTWLGRARELLATRLTRRGISVGAAVLATGLSSVAEAGVVPATFVGSTITAASLYGAGHLAVAGGLSSSTSALAGGCMQAAFWSPLRLAVATIVGCLTVGTVAAGLILGAGESEPSANTPPPSAPLSEPPAAPIPDDERAQTPPPIEEETDPLFGAIQGQVVCDGVVPPQQVLLEFPPPDKDILDESLIVDPKSSGIANVFIFLKKAPDSIPVSLQAVPTTPVVVDNVGRGVYVPHAFFVRTGQPIQFLNGTTVIIYVHTLPIRNPASNFMLKPLDRVGVSVVYPNPESLPFPILDDIRPWSRANALFVDHPYAAITDAQGKFHISHLPAGKHSFRIWHERVGFIERDYPLTVVGGQVITLPLLTVPAQKLLKR